VPAYDSPQPCHPPRHIRRIEGGILAYGCVMTIEENPYEVGYAYHWMVELEQEQDFIGREALREVAQRGVTHKLVGVELGGARLAPTATAQSPTGSRGVNCEHSDDFERKISGLR
jgi:glycine cleavage system aminomethyltransferase T